MPTRTPPAPYGQHRSEFSLARRDYPGWSCNGRPTIDWVDHELDVLPTAARPDPWPGQVRYVLEVQAEEAFRLACVGKVWRIRNAFPVIRVSLHVDFNYPGFAPGVPIRAIELLTRVENLA